MKQNSIEHLKNQSGQSLIEFVLLLLIIVILSVSFLKIVNNNLANQWLKIATVIVDDPSQTLTLK